MADIFPTVVAGKGYELRTLYDTIPAIVGTAAHAGIQHMLEGNGLQACVARAKNSLKDEIQKAGGVHESLFDKVTPSKAIAFTQLERMLASYTSRAAAIQAMGMLTLEQRLTATLFNTQVAGSPDTIAGTTLIDIKTGKSRPHQAQIGAYILLAEANGQQITHAFIDSVKRSPNKKQPAVTVEEIDVAQAKRAAQTAIQAFDRVVTTFSENGDKHAILENPSSGLCQKRYCSAWGTDFCGLWKRNPPLLLVEDGRDNSTEENSNE